jgi:hypothetical protein
MVSFPVEEGNEVKDRVLETVGFRGANPICDGGGWTNTGDLKVAPTKPPTHNFLQLSTINIEKKTIVWYNKNIEI